MTRRKPRATADTPYNPAVDDDRGTRLDRALLLIGPLLAAAVFLVAAGWTGPDALAAGIVQQTASAEKLGEVALQRAKELAPLGANRKNYGGQKERIFGEHAAINYPHGAAYMLRNLADYH